MDDSLHEHLLISFAKQAICGLCTGKATGAIRSPEIARMAFNVAEAAIAEFEERTEKRKKEKKK
jgi:hypothetical protein